MKIYLRFLNNLWWAHNGQASAVGTLKEAVIEEIKALCPGTYEIVEI